MRRVLTPELLDLLEPDDPAAIASRRDLARINWIMRQPAIIANALSRFPAPRVIADLGGGDGRFMLAVARRLARHWPGVTLMICDRADIVSAHTQAAFRALGWTCESRTGDIFETLPEADIVTANLFLHHFDDAALAQLLAAVAQKTRAFVACEPRRNIFALVAARLVWALGANAVTRHDAVVSVEAGFGAQELTAHWPTGWQTTETFTFPFTHVFAAHAL